MNLKDNKDNPIVTKEDRITKLSDSVSLRHGYYSYEDQYGNKVIKFYAREIYRFV